MPAKDGEAFGCASLVLYWEQEICRLGETGKRWWNMLAWKNGLLAAVFAAACGWGMALDAPCASAEDMWVYRGYDDVDYFLQDETIRIDGDDWLVDVKVVDRGQLKFVAPFRFRMTGNWVDDIEERTVQMWWVSKKRWIDMGISSKDPLARALWVDGLLPYVGGDDSATETEGGAVTEADSDATGETTADDGI